MKYILGLMTQSKQKAWKFLKTAGKDFVFFHLYPTTFKLYSHKPISQTLVLLVTCLHEEIPDNLKMIKDEMVKKGFTCKIFLKPQLLVKRGVLPRILNHLHLLIHNLKFQKYYAQCSYCFLTEYFSPVYANNPRPGVQVIQLWHACGAFKKVGYSTADSKWGPSLITLRKYRAHSTTTAVMVSSNKIVPDYAEAFSLPEQIIYPLGVPRTDIFYNQAFIQTAPEQLRKIFPQIGARKIILYAPTFRGDSLSRSYYVKMLDYVLMKRFLSQDYVFLTKLHPLTAKAAGLTTLETELYGNFVLDASSCLDINTALCAADILITDYSTVMCEYALLERPMIFYAYDLEQYDRDRSFYYDYKDFVPGPIVSDTLQLIEAIRQTEHDFNRAQIKKFRNDFMNACDGHSTERIVNFVINNREKP